MIPKVKKKLVVLFVATTFLAIFALIGCNKSQEPASPAAGPAPEQGASAVPGAPGTSETSAPLPPPIASQAPPDMIAMPDASDVYAAPDVDADLFFWDGWWWRLWDGRWYRSSHYDRGWGYYNTVPSFYFDVDPGWRGYYRNHNWGGHRWDYERIPHQQLQQNWKGWHNDRHWERQGTWGVQSYQPRSPQQMQVLRQQRQQQYQQRPEVQQHQQQRQSQVERARSRHLRCSNVRGRDNPRDKDRKLRNLRVKNTRLRRPRCSNISNSIQPQEKAPQLQKQGQRPQAQKPEVQQLQQQKQPQAQKPRLSNRQQLEKTPGPKTPGPETAGPETSGPET